MKRLQNHLIGVDQGEIQIFSHFQDDGPMWSGTGPRRAARSVRFSEPFRHPPAVHVSLAMWDIHASTNPRMDLTAEEVTTEGFTILLQTWGDTQIARARANWLAIGELPHEDDWNIP